MKEIDFLIGELKKRSPEEVKAWLLGDESLVPLAVRYRFFIKGILAGSKELRERLKNLTYEEVKEEVCKVYPELVEVFNLDKVRVKVEAEILAIKQVLGVI